MKWINKPQICSHLAEEKSKMRNRGKRGGRRVGCIVCGRLNVQSYWCSLWCVMLDAFAWVTLARIHPQLFLCLVISQAQDDAVAPPSSGALMFPPWNIWLVLVLPCSHCDHWWRRVGCSYTCSVYIFHMCPFFLRRVQLVGRWQSQGAVCIHFTKCSSAHLDVSCFSLLPLTCCMLSSVCYTFLCRLCVFFVFRVFSLGVTFVFCWEAVLTWCFFLFFPRLISASSSLVHLGRSFGASLSWPVTLVTRWTSALLISARGRCWWASWTRIARDCDTITTARTRWHSWPRENQPLDLSAKAGVLFTVCPFICMPESRVWSMWSKWRKHACSHCFVKLISFADYIVIVSINRLDQ